MTFTEFENEVKGANLDTLFQQIKDDEVIKSIYAKHCDVDRHNELALIMMVKGARDEKLATKIDYVSKELLFKLLDAKLSENTVQEKSNE